VKKTNSIDKIM